MTEADKISRAFLKLLETNDFESATPKRICDLCMIPVGRFNMSYHDTYALTEEILGCEYLSVSAGGIEAKSFGEAFTVSMSFALSYPEAAANLARSSASDILTSHIYRMAERESARLIPKDRSDRENLIRFISYAASSIAVSELSEGKSAKDIAERYCDIFDRIPLN